MAIETALKAGASYVDIRLVERRLSAIIVKNDNVESLTENVSGGFGVRALADGSWGFSSSSGMENGEIRRVAEEAVRIARASARVRREEVSLAEVGSKEGSYRSAFRMDPWDVPLEEKMELLMDAQRTPSKDEAIKVRKAQFQAFRERKTFASSEGSYIEQDILQSGAGIEVLALRSGEVHKRSYPAPFGGNFRTAGWEFIESMDLVGNAERTAREAVALLDAKKCPSGKRDVIIGTNQLALQVHESCGHPTELDRVLGMEASYAGTSFLTPDKLDSFRYGSEKVNIVADSMVEGGLGTFGYDDEGVPAKRVDLVREGIFVGYQNSRETAELFGHETSGNMRADGWGRIPLIRMTNISLLPGDWDLDELVEDTDEGIYMETNKSWSIDDLRLNFQFATEVAWEIVGGELGELIKYPNYTGITYEFWRGCDAVCDEDRWHLWGVPNCGKGEPGQVARVGHGTSPARFRGVRVGVA
ncbi:MAG: TldD/PmbA family protein [Thermoplasmata archaeon]